MINIPQTKEVYDLLCLNYVEDDHASFRFQYTAEFFEWFVVLSPYLYEWVPDSPEIGHSNLQVITRNGISVFELVQIRDWLHSFLGFQ